jgi:hypothetical protein
MRYQQVYLGFEVGKGEISELRFRQDSEFGSAFGPWFIPNVTIQLSSTMTAHPFGPLGGLSSTFADNIGPDATTVFVGNLTLSSNESLAVPRPFDIVVRLTPRFFFDSSTGANLLLDVTVPSCGFTTTQDLHSEVDDGVARVASYDSMSPTARAAQDTGGLVTQFLFLVSEDGFESGDTSAWSLTMP